MVGIVSGCSWHCLPTGSSLIGYAFLILYLASGLVEGSWGSIESTRWTPQNWRKLFVVSIATLAALFLNPHRWRLVAYLPDLMFRQQLTVAVIDEWRSVDFLAFYGALIFLIVAGIILFTLGQRPSWQFSVVLFALFASRTSAFSSLPARQQRLLAIRPAKGQALAKH